MFPLPPPRPAAMVASPVSKPSEGKSTESPQEQDPTPPKALTSLDRDYHYLLRLEAETHALFAKIQQRAERSKYRRMRLFRRMDEELESLRHRRAVAKKRAAIEKEVEVEEDEVEGDKDDAGEGEDDAEEGDDDAEYGDDCDTEDESDHGTVNESDHDTDNKDDNTAMADLEDLTTQLQTLSVVPETEIVLPIKGELRERLNMSALEAAGPSLPVKYAGALGDLTFGDMESPSIDSVLDLTIGDNILAKFGRSDLIDLREARNLDYIHSKISDFPAPRCLGAIVLGECTYLYMTRPEGQSLETLWPRLPALAKLSVRFQLDDIFGGLRKLRRTDRDHRFGNCFTGVCKDGRYRNYRVSTSKIESEIDFNAFLFERPGRPIGPQLQSLRDSMPTNHKIRLSHGNLHPPNIMVSARTAADGSPRGIRISAITSWEHAGWYPEHWDFVQAMHNADRQGELRDWAGYLPGAIGVYEAEYAKDAIRIKGVR